LDVRNVTPSCVRRRERALRASDEQHVAQIDGRAVHEREDDVRNPWKDWKDDRLDPRIFRKSIQQ
jgi:hypothetical protein